MKYGKASRVVNILIILLICGIFAYILLRAYFLSFTHDESQTFKILIGDHGVANTANNHWLNTWLMSLFFYLFGAKEIVLRLPNVLSFLIYGSFGYLLIIRVKPVYFRFAVFCLLFLNPYLIDFFSIARGYGLGLAFSMAAIGMYIIRSEKTKSAKEVIITFAGVFLFSLCASFANLSFLNLNIGLILLLILDLFFKNRRVNLLFNWKWTAVLSMIFIINIAVLVILIDHLLFLKSNNELYIGGNDNIIDNTLTLLIHRSIYLAYYGESFWINLRLGVIILFFIILLVQLINKKYSDVSRVTILLVLLLFASILQHYIFKTLYPTERASVIFLPVFSLLLIYQTLDIYDYLKIRSPRISQLVISLISILIVTISVFHSRNNISFKYSLDWKDDANTKAAMNLIREEVELNRGHSFAISNDWYFEPTINYYRYVYNMNNLAVANRDGLTQNSTFVYCKAQSDIGLILAGKQYVIMKKFEDTETVLYRIISH